MTRTNVKFGRAAIASLASAHAQNKIALALGDDAQEAQLSRLMDELKPNSDLCRSFYNATMNAAAPPDPLSVEFEDVNGQARLQKNINRHMKNITNDLIAAFLTPDRSDISHEVKAAIGESNYNALQKKYGTAIIIKYLIQGALVSYAQAVAPEHTKALGVRIGTFGAQGATDDQLESINLFSFNVVNKLNEYPSCFHLDFILDSLAVPLTKLSTYKQALESDRTNLDNKLNQNNLSEAERGVLTQKRAGLSSKIEDVGLALDRLSELRDKINSEIQALEDRIDLDTMTKRKEYSELSTKYAAEISSTVNKYVLQKPALIQLRSWFQRFLSTIYRLVNMQYMSNTQKAVATLGVFSIASPAPEPGVENEEPLQTSLDIK